MATHLPVCGQAAPCRRGEGLDRRTRWLSCLSQEPDLFLENVDGTIGSDQIFCLLLVSGP